MDREPRDRPRVANTDKPQEETPQNETTAKYWHGGRSTCGCTAALHRPPISYVVNIGAAVEAGVDAEDIQGVLAAVAPIVGTRIAAAADALVEAIAVEIAVAALEVEEAAT